MGDGNYIEFVKIGDEIVSSLPKNAPSLHTAMIWAGLDLGVLSYWGY